MFNPNELHKLIIEKYNINLIQNIYNIKSVFRIKKII